MTVFWLLLDSRLCPRCGSAPAASSLVFLQDWKYGGGDDEDEDEMASPCGAHAEFVRHALIYEPVSLPHCWFPDDGWQP